MKIILFFTLLLSLNIYAQENYKLMFYNVLNYPSSNSTKASVFKEIIDFTNSDLLMLTEMFCIFVVFPFAFGRIKSSASGVIAGEVSKKKTNNRNTISVIEDMLNSGLTLFLPRKFIIKQVH